MFKDYKIVKMKWWQRVGALLFGKKTCSVDVSKDGTSKTIVSYWRGVYYIIYLGIP